MAPLSLWLPVVGLSAAILLDKLSALQLLGAVLIMAGLYINVFGLRACVGRRECGIRAEKKPRIGGSKTKIRSHLIIISTPNFVGFVATRPMWV